MVDEMTITIDRTTAMMLNLLHEHLEKEPKMPSDDMPWEYLQVVSHAYADWQKSVNGLRALCGVRMINCALDQLEGMP